MKFIITVHQLLFFKTTALFIYLGYKDLKKNILNSYESKKNSLNMRATKKSST